MIPTAFLNTLTQDGGAYLISSAGDLCALSAYVNAGNDCAGVKFKLNADIDLSGVRYTAIGDGNHHYQGTFFQGTFDGDGHTVSNLTINTRVDYQGLFGYIGRGGTVKNVKLKNADINGGDNVGGITGRNDGTISDCSVSGKVTSARWTAGGIAGHNLGTIEHSTSIFYGTAQSANVGGIAGSGSGESSGTISDCYVIVKRISSKKNIGGIAGRNPRPSSAHGWYYSDDKSLRGVGDGQGYNNTGKLYRISLLKASGVKANPKPPVASSGVLYYEDGSTITLDGELAAGDEIEINGFGSTLTLSGNTATIGRLTITLNLSLPNDAYGLKVSGNKIICAADETAPAEEITINVTIKISAQGVQIIGDDSFSTILKKLLK